MLLSVIVPIYNGEKTLPDLIEPLLEIDNGNIEFILVDDGSKDSSYHIIKQYAENDQRIKPIHIENSGVSVARNTGIKNALGKYVYFCDCDDFIFTGTLAKIISILEENKYDLITADYIYKYSDTGTTVKNNIALPPLCQLSKAEIIENFISPLVLRNGTGLASLWNKFFRLNLINKHLLTFNPKIHKGEDWQFILKYLSFCESAYYLPETLYEYRLDGSQKESKYKREPGIHMLSLTGLKMQLAEDFHIKVSKDQFAIWCADIISQLVFAAKSSVSQDEWSQMTNNNFVIISARTLKSLKLKEYLRLEISRKYKIYSLCIVLKLNKFLRFLIRKTN